MRDNTRAVLALKPGGTAATRPRPVIGMRYAGEHGARRRVNATLVGGSAADRAARPVTQAWRAYVALLGLIFLPASAFRFPAGHYYQAGKAAPMLSTRDCCLTQQSRPALHLDIQAGGRDLDSRVDPVQVTFPPNLLRVRIVIECCVSVPIGTTQETRSNSPLQHRATSCLGVCRRLDVKTSNLAGSEFLNISTRGPD